jgi:rhodanese-related sulfurtransferase
MQRIGVEVGFGALVGLLLVVAAWTARAGEGHTVDALPQVKAAVRDHRAVLVDVREKRETDRGTIRGAVLLPLSDLMTWKRDGVPAEARDQIQKAIPKGTIIYTHCAAGGRALLAADPLRTLGYEVRPLEPGYNALVEAGFPVSDME